MKLSLTLLLMFASTISFSQNEDQKIKKLDTLFERLHRARMSMGSISIYKNGKEIYNKIYGISNIKKSDTTLASEKTMYRIGSISKVFTAFLVMKLAEEGKLTIDQNLASYFPGLDNAGSITIRQLLSHKSLLPIFHRVDDLEKLRKLKKEEELIVTINKREQNADTAKLTYNNLNYILLGLIVEKTTGKKYTEVLESYIKDLPHHKVYGTYSYLDHTKNEANSFHIEKEEWIEDFEIRESPISDGSGFLISNARAINEFMEALFSYNLISEESLNLMLPDKSIFGFGLMKTNYDKHKGFGHSGRIEGFTSATSYFPQDKISITLLQNGTVYPLNDIMIYIGGIIFDQPVTFPNFEKVELSKTDIEKLTGTYSNDEEGYKVIVDTKGSELRLRVAKGKGLLNKMILANYALGKNRLFNPTQGIIFDFIDLKGEKYGTCVMKVNGARLTLVREGN